MLKWVAANMLEIFTRCICLCGSRDSLALPNSDVLRPGQQEQDLSLLYSVQTGSGIHPAFFPNGTGGYFPGGKAAGV
jgi:hypothetical protein